MYSNFTALYQVDFSIPTGGIVGLLGPNGSGKTTLIKLAMGMLHPTAGDILVDGKKPDHTTRAITAYLPDANYL
ncbi:MAG: ATP-binding cassette domain-containing protein, partial [Clostridia bacterium]|nr:ATP-binding cassette domain-containing protein [Clostridia bacterium]